MIQRIFGKSQLQKHQIFWQKVLYEIQRQTYLGRGYWSSANSYDSRSWMNISWKIYWGLELLSLDFPPNVSATRIWTFVANYAVSIEICFEC